MAMEAMSFCSGFMVMLKALPPTIWWRWGEGAMPGLTRLCYMYLETNNKVVRDKNVRVKTVHHELRAREPQLGSIDAWSQHRGCEERCPVHVDWSLCPFSLSGW